MNYLMDQTIMNFAGTAARSSAIATPTTGMTTYIKTTGTATIPQIEVYTGAAWQVPYGMSLVANITTSSATSVQINNCFTSAFENYRIVMAISGPSVSSTNVLALFSTGGTTDPTAANYVNVGFEQAYNNATVVAFANNGAVTYVPIGRIDSSGTGASLVADVFSPQLAQKTWYTSSYQDRLYAGKSAGANVSNNQFDGIRITANGQAFTSTIRIYGMRNS
jgi:hypothetical protein